MLPRCSATMNALALIESFFEHMARSPSLFSAQRLHSIAGKYTGKDDPVAIVRNQGIFPAPEEIISPFAKAHFVGGDARGSHVAAHACAT